MQRWSPAKARIAVGATIVLFVSSLFWKVLFSDEYSMLAYHDNSVQSYAWLQYLTWAIRQGCFPWWDPFAEGGRSFVGELQTGAFYPPSLALSLLPRDELSLLPVIYIHWFLLVHLVVACLLTYKLATDLGMGRIGALIAGLTFAFSGSIANRAFAQANLFCSAVWTPGIVLFYLRALRAKTLRGQILNANLTGLLLALSLLAGHHQPPLYGCLGLGFLTIVLLGTRREHRLEGCSRLRLLRVLCLTMLFAFCYGSFQLMASKEYSHLAYRWIDNGKFVPADARLPYSEISQNSLISPPDLILLIFPFLSDVENSPYLGILPLLFLCFSLSRFRSDPKVRFLWLGAAFFFALSFGGYSILHGLLYLVVPGFDKGREASRVLVIAHCCLGLLVGLGCETFLGATKKKDMAFRSRTSGAFALISAGLLSVIFGSCLWSFVHSGTSRKLTGLAFAGLLILLTSWLGLARVFACLTRQAIISGILILLAFDYYFFVNAHIKATGDFDGKNNLEPAAFYSDQETVHFLQAQTGVFRIAFSRETHPANIGDVWRKDTIGGWGATRSRRFMTFLSHSNSADSRIVDLLNVRYVVTSAELTLPRVFEGKRAKVYENLNYLPRAWLVARVVSSKYPELFDRLLSPNFDPRAEALIEDEEGPTVEWLEGQGSTSASGSTGKTGEVSFRRLSPTSFIVDLQSGRAQPEFLVVSENWYPGWIAKINGKDVQVKCVNGSLMGTWVLPDQTEIEFSYRPTYMKSAAILTSLSILVLILARTCPGRFRLLG